MKILLHSNAPWVPSGYGKQAALAARILVGLGHQVSFSAFSGLGGQPITWQVPGVTGRKGVCAVYPSGQVPFSPDVLVPNATVAQADLIVSLMDTYKLMPAAKQIRACGIPFAPLVVTDCIAANGGPSILDQQIIAASGALPAAVSAFGHERLIDYGPDDWEVPYVPHTVDTDVFKPPPDRAALRDEMETAGQFVIGICGANRDLMRKGFAEQFEAFARFARRHKDARLAVFTVADSVNGIPVAEIASDLGIMDRTVFMPTYEQVSGLLAEDFMATWYGSLDILSMCSYAEGFGVPALEAQACGTPVVATDGSAMPELVRSAGWLVKGHPYWNAVLRGWWMRPDVDSIVKAWEKAYQYRDDPDRRARAIAFAGGYSLDHAAKHWAGFLGDIQDWTDEHAGKVVYDGLRWHVDDVGEQFGDVLALGHESMFSDEILGRLGEGSVFVDVGAHVGHWSVRAAALGARVISVEADPETAERLHENLKLNDLDAEIYSLAAWDEVTELHLNRQQGEGHGYGHDGTNQVRPEGDGQMVKAEPLDITLGHLKRVDLIKIDVEGADLHVLRGLRETLTRLRPPMFIEDHSVHGMYDRADLDALLVDLGYRWRNLPHGYLIATAA